MAPASVRQIAVPTTLSAGERSAIAGVLDDLLKRKMRGTELDQSPRIAVISNWIDAQRSHFDRHPVLGPAMTNSVGELARIFHK